MDLKARLKRRVRIRKKVSGDASRPRLSVFRSLNNIYAQVIDDTAGKTLVSASSLAKDFKGSGHLGNKKAAEAVGQLLGEKAIKQGIKQVVFDRGGYIYHGRVKALAEGARKAGLEF